MNFLKKHWFQITVIVLLLMCFFQLKDMGANDYVPTYNSQMLEDIVTSNLNQEDYLAEIVDELGSVNDSVNNVWLEVQDLR